MCKIYDYLLWKNEIYVATLIIVYHLWPQVSFLWGRHASTEAWKGQIAIYPTYESTLIGFYVFLPDLFLCICSTKIKRNQVENYPYRAVGFSPQTGFLVHQVQTQLAYFLVQVPWTFVFNQAEKEQGRWIQSSKLCLLLRSSLKSQVQFSWCQTLFI